MSPHKLLGKGASIEKYIDLDEEDNGKRGERAAGMEMHLTGQYFIYSPEALDSSTLCRDRKEDKGDKEGGNQITLQVFT